jgi:hypothetical protein
MTFPGKIGVGQTSMPLYTNSLNHRLTAIGLLAKIFTDKKAYPNAKTKKAKKRTATRKNICSHNSLIQKVGRSEDEKVH